MISNGNSCYQVWFQNYTVLKFGTSTEFATPNVKYIYNIYNRNCNADIFKYISQKVVIRMIYNFRILDFKFIEIDLCQNIDELQLIMFSNNNYDIICILELFIYICIYMNFNLRFF